MYVDHQNIVFSRLSRQSTNTIMTGSWHGVAKFVIVKIMSKVGYQNRVLPDDPLTVFIWNCNFYFYSLCTYECRCHWFQSGWGTFEVLQHQLHHPDITTNKHYMNNMRGQNIHFIHIHTGCSYLTSYCCEIAPHWVLGRMSRKCPRVTPHMAVLGNHLQQEPLALPYPEQELLALPYPEQELLALVDHQTARKRVVLLSIDAPKWMFYQNTENEINIYIYIYKSI